MGGSASRVRNCLGDSSAKKSVLVTGGNTGIGFALCEQLCKDGYFVLLCSRSQERGEAAVQEIRKSAPDGEVALVLLDVASEASVQAAVPVVAGLVQARGRELYAVVNNAATGLMHNVSDEVALQTNFWGVKRVSEAFLPLLGRAGRIVNVGSTAGPTYLSARPLEEQKLLTSPSLSLAQLEEYARTGPDSSTVPEILRGVPGMAMYLFSKAVMTAYTAVFARENPHVTVVCIAPGWIDTAINKGMGATAPPAVGTGPIRFALFERVGQGWFYECDCKRAAPHGPVRATPAGPLPDVPEYDGALP